MSNIESIHINKHRHKEIFSLLQQLTTAQHLDNLEFNDLISSLKSNHHIYLYIKDNKVVGTITLLIEQKLIHQGKCVGHIEDLVVDKDHNGMGIAKNLLAYALQIAKDNNCYKVILDCDKKLIPFYEKSGFKEKDIQMALYLN